MFKHRKPQKSILSGEFGDPYGRAESRRSGGGGGGGGGGWGGGGGGGVGGGGWGGFWVSCFSKVLETFQAQMQILKSKPVE